MAAGAVIRLAGWLAGWLAAGSGMVAGRMQMHARAGALSPAVTTAAAPVTPTTAAHLALRLAHHAKGRQQLGAALNEGLQGEGHLTHSGEELWLVGVAGAHRRQHPPQPLVSDTLQVRGLLLGRRCGAIPLLHLRVGAGPEVGGAF